MTKTMDKVLIFNKILLLNDSNELISENLKLIDLFNEKGIHVGILARENSLRQLSNCLPEQYKNKILLFKRGPKARKLVNDFKNKGIAVFIIGKVNEDAIFSFNCKVPLFYLESLNSKTIIAEEKVINYGLFVKTYQDIIDCLKAQDVHQKSYFELNDTNNDFTIISLNNANTIRRPENEIKIKKIFESNLKGNEFTRNQKILLLLFFNLLGEIRKNKYFDEVKYWGTFPSSNPRNKNTSITYIKEAVRKLKNGYPQKEEEILIRHRSMIAKKDSQDRLRFKCDKDFETLMVNPELKGKLDNEVVCIIDDYMTNGYSAESAKHILFAAGAKKVIFITLGKFGRRYYSTNYSIKGDVFTKNYEYEFKSEKLITNMSNYNTDNDYQILGFDGLV